jgi:exopolysaccharide biosynthesis polyprenyl glycosylphosphotransferase
MPGAVRLVVDVAMLALATLAASWSAAADGKTLYPEWGIVVFPALVVLLLHTRGLYACRLRIEVLDTVLWCLSAVSIAAMAVLAVGNLMDPARDPVMFRLWSFAALFVVAGRTLVTAAERALRRRGVLAQPTIIVGAGAIGNRVARRLREHPEYGLRPVAFVDDPPPGPVHPVLPIAGSLGELSRALHRTGARHVIVAFSTSRDREIVTVAREAQREGVAVSVVPRLFDLTNHRSALEHVGGLPVLRLRSADADRPRLWLKHALDRITGSVAVALLLPVLLAIAVAVRLSSPGPVIFRQRRVGRHGREFDVLKFRSMRPAAEPHPFVRELGRAPGGVEGADRRTAVGRLLRRTSLDELPQLINIAAGDMSFVGPRPERPEFVESLSREIENYGDRHRVKPGLTGWAQINNLRGQTSAEKRVEWDNWYIENWSPWLDIKIVALTFAAVLRGGEGVS